MHTMSSSNLVSMITLLSRLKPRGKGQLKLGEIISSSLWKLVSVALCRRKTTLIEASKMARLYLSSRVHLTWCLWWSNTRNKINFAKFLETEIYLCRHKSKYFSSESGFRSKTLIFHQCCNLYDHAGQLRHSKNLWLKVVVREKFGRGQWCWFSRFFVFSLEMGN